MEFYIEKIEKTENIEKEWLSLIQYVRNECPYGEMTIIFRDGVPFQATVIKQSIRF
jgi:hypothetical protein